MTAVAKQWTQADLERLIGERESLQLEFKACGALSKNPQAKDELAKDISAMANAAGGTIIYGIKEKDHVAESVDEGFNENEITKEWLGQVIDSNIQPRMEGLSISVVPLAAGKVAYVVTVAQAVGRAPHQAPDKRYYKRVNFLNQTMEDYEIRDALRRAQWPLLSVEWKVVNVKLLDRRDRAYREITLEARITNESTEPAYHSSLRFFFDQRLEITNAGECLTNGLLNLPDQTRAKVFLLERMPPKHFPIIKEEPISMYFTVQYKLDDGIDRFGFGERLLAPGCAAENFRILVWDGYSVQLGKMRR